MRSVEKHNRLMFLKRDIFNLILDNYKYNQTVTSMKLIAQRFNRRYQSLVGVYESERVPLQKFIEGLVETKIIVCHYNINGSLVCLPRQVAKMYAVMQLNSDSYPDIDTSIEPEMILKGIRKGPCLTDIVHDAIRREIDSFAVEIASTQSRLNSEVLELFNKHEELSLKDLRKLIMSSGYDARAISSTIDMMVSSNTIVSDGDSYRLNLTV